MRAPQRDYPMTKAEPQPAAARPELSAPMLAVWSVVAAFGTYFCMYAFRKPFTAAAFSGMTAWGIGEKTLLVTAQVLGLHGVEVPGHPRDRRDATGAARGR